jgi:hypothetical protein
MGEPLDALDRALDQQRLALGLGWRELAQQAGVSYEAVRALRKSGVSSSLTKRRLEEALGWIPGSIDALLHGGTATIVVDDDPPPRGQTAATIEELEAIRQQLEEALRRLGEIQLREAARHAPARRGPNAEQLEDDAEPETYAIWVEDDADAASAKLVAAERELRLAQEDLAELDRKIESGQMERSPGTETLRARLVAAVRGAEVTASEARRAYDGAVQAQERHTGRTGSVSDS